MEYKIILLASSNLLTIPGLPWCIISIRLSPIHYLDALEWPLHPENTRVGSWVTGMEAGLFKEMEKKSERALTPPTRTLKLRRVRSSCTAIHAPTPVYRLPQMPTSRQASMPASASADCRYYKFWRLINISRRQIDGLNILEDIDVDMLIWKKHSMKLQIPGLSGADKMVHMPQQSYWKTFQ